MTTEGEIVQQSTLTFEWDASSTRHPDEELSAFYRAHPTWADEKTDGDGVLLCLSQSHFDAAVGLYRIDSATQQAERDFTALCDNHDAIGVSCGRFMNYPWLRPDLPLPPREDVMVLARYCRTNTAVRLPSAVSTTRRVGKPMKAYWKSIIGNMFSGIVTNRRAMCVHLSQRWKPYWPQCLT